MDGTEARLKQELQALRQEAERARQLAQLPDRKAPSSLRQRVSAWLGRRAAATGAGLRGAHEADPSLGLADGYPVEGQ